MKYLMTFIAILFSLTAIASDIATTLSVRQIQPWNGLVEISVGLSCSSQDLVDVACTFVATNSATQVALPVSHIRQVGCDTGSGSEWQRRFVWDAVADVGEVKIDDVVLTVDAFVGVQLWEDGPYWATCNIGATKPDGYGYYFWWGDTVGYKRNKANNQWVSVGDEMVFSFDIGICPTYGKRSADLQSAGYIDSAGNLVAAHDAATAHLGAPWRIPTDAEFSALISNCDTEWTSCNGVSGRLVKGRGAYASKSIFLPDAGYGYNSKHDSLGWRGCYWSSTTYSYDPHYAWHLRFDSDDFDRYFVTYYRSYGLSVRPVRGFAK